MKNTNTFMIEELREMILINFIGKVSGHNNMPSADKVIKMPCGNYMLREIVPDIFDRNIYPSRRTYHFRQKKEKKPKKNNCHRKIALSEFPVKKISSLDDSIDEDVP
jgi:hypothetical protein